MKYSARQISLFITILLIATLIITVSKLDIVNTEKEIKYCKVINCYTSYKPVSVHPFAESKYIVVLANSYTFSSYRPYQIGDSVQCIFYRYKEK